MRSRLASIRGALRGVTQDGLPFEPGGDWGVYRSTIGGYMDRLIVRTPRGTVRLHWILREDRSPDPHDHPFAFTSIILRGGYLEERWVGGKRLASWHLPGSVVRREATDLHSLIKVLPGTVTFVVSGPKVRTWGFQTADGWVAWREYRRRRAAR